MKKDVAYTQQKRGIYYPGHNKVSRGFRLTFLLFMILSAGFIFLGCPTQYVTRYPDPDKPLIFPKDHAAHENAQHEWWYYNGRLESPNGNKYDFFCGFFRNYVENDAILGVPMNWITWPWPISQYFPFHFVTFSILDHQRNKYERKYKSIMPFFWAGDSKTNNFDFKLGSNRAWLQSDGTFRVQFSLDGYDLDLIMTPERPPLQAGFKHDGTLTPDVSCMKYYSITRLSTNGTLRYKNRTHKVTGLSWMDHQYGFILQPTFQAWHWMSINLDNGADLVFGVVNLYSRAVHPESFVGIMFPDDRVEYLEAKDFTMRPLRTWKSKFTRVTYGVDWELEVPAYNIKLHTKALKDEQQMYTFFPPILFWEGPSHVEGTFQGEKVLGRAFLETLGDNKMPFRKLYQTRMKPLRKTYDMNK